VTYAESRGLVNIQGEVEGVFVDLGYARERNSFGRRLYDGDEAYLLAPAARRLAAAAAAAYQAGLSLVVLDAYRPLSVQALMWEILPDDDFVAPPSRGSIHNRGAAVDVTLATRDGRRLPMPSEYDEFSERASHEYAGGGEPERRNRETLRDIMIGAGFAPYVAEWWHYVDPELRGSPLIDVPISALRREAGPG